MFFAKLVAGVLLLSCLLGASIRTDNFIIHAERLDTVQFVAQAAEAERDRIAMFWLGRTLPRWSSPCRILVQEGRSSPQGWSSMHPDYFDVEMEVVGKLDSILKDVLPHEICHVILFYELGGALPRWLDEGAAAAMESASARADLLANARAVVENADHLPLHQVLTATAYPAGNRQALIFYFQAAAFSVWVIEEAGMEVYTALLYPLPENELPNADATAKTLGHNSVADCEGAWHAWLLRDSAAVPAALAAKQ